MIKSKTYTCLYCGGSGRQGEIIIKSRIPRKKCIGCKGKGHIALTGLNQQKETFKWYEYLKDKKC